MNVRELLLCRLKRSELPSSTGVTSFILRLSFPSPFSTVSSPLSPDVMALAAIATSADTSLATFDLSLKEVISEEKEKEAAWRQFLLQHRFDI